MCLLERVQLSCMHFWILNHTICTFDRSGMFIGKRPSNQSFGRGLQHCSFKCTTPNEIIQSWLKKGSFSLKSDGDFFSEESDCTYSTLCNKPWQSFFQKGAKKIRLSKQFNDRSFDSCFLWETILRKEGFSTKVKGQSRTNQCWGQRLTSETSSLSALHRHASPRSVLSLVFLISLINSLGRWVRRAGCVCDGSS